MTTAILLLLSGAMIGAGLTVLVRDMRKNRRRAFVTARDVRGWTDTEAEITITHADPARGRGDMRREPMRAPPVTAAAALPVATAPTAPPPPPRERPEPPRPAEGAPLEQQWAALEAAIAAGVDRVNAHLAPTRLSISAPGEPAWSYKNKGFGGYRRLMLGRDSLAWLRLELAADGRLHASVKAHKDDGAGINAAADGPVTGLDAAGIADLLAQCLKPAVDHLAGKDASRDGDETASEQAWQSVDALVASALKATNGALGQAGARLVPLGPAAWEPDLRRHRMTLGVEVNGTDVARMHIERWPHEMEVAVGVRESRLADLSRRRRLPVEGMTIHALAELIAGCAWPAIARLKEAPGPA